jgi:hypothetical protein
VRLAITILVLLTSTAHADRALQLDVRCPAAASPDELASALSLELAGTDWHLADSDAEATVTIDADPCEPASPLHITIAAPSPLLVLDAVVLPERERARAVALLVADLVDGLVPAPSSDPDPAAAPDPAPAAAAVPVPTPTPLVFERPPGSRQPFRLLPFGLTTTLAVTYRKYGAWGTIGQGSRLSVSRALPGAPSLRASLSGELDEASTRMGFGLRTWRGGAKLTGRARWGRVTLDVGARAEVGHYTLVPDLMTIAVDVRSPWTSAAAGTIGGELELLGGLALHFDVESGATIHSRDVVIENLGPYAPPPYDVSVLSGRYWSATLGLTVR